MAEPWELYQQQQASPQSMTVEDVAKLYQAPLKGRQFIPDTEGGRGALQFAGDIGRATAGGLVQGAMAIPDIANAAQSGVNWVVDQFAGPIPKEGREALQRTRVGSPEMLRAVEGTTGVKLGAETAQTPLGKTLAPYAQTAASFVPMALATGGGAIAGGVIPGLVSEGAGQATKGTGYEMPARLAGGVVGGVLGAAGRRLVTPNPIPAERQALVDVLTKEGVGLTAGQKVGSKGLRYMESTLGDLPGAGGKTAAISDRQLEQFTTAALKRTGEQGTRANPEAINAAFNRIGAQYDQLAARNVLVPDVQFQDDLINAARQYAKMVGPNNRSPAVESWIMDIADAARKNGGSIPGPVYQSYRSQIGELANGTGNNELASALKGIRGALDSAMGRSISPADQAAWQEANRQYRNLQIIQKAATGAGEKAAEGLISPSQLRNATVGEGRRAYARGQGDFAELARAGEAIMKPLPQSGTAPRVYSQNIIAALLGGGGIGGAAAGFPGAAIGAGAALSPAVLGRMLMSKAGQAYLGNQVLPKMPPGQMARTLLPTTASVVRERGY